jgi:hypothetical protein
MPLQGKDMGDPSGHGAANHDSSKAWLSLFRPAARHSSDKTADLLASEGGSKSTRTHHKEDHYDGEEPVNICCCLEIYFRKKTLWGIFHFMIFLIFYVPPIIYGVLGSCSAIGDLTLFLTIFGTVIIINRFVMVLGNIGFNPNAVINNPELVHTFSFQAHTVLNISTLGLAIWGNTFIFDQISSRFADGGHNCQMATFQTATFCCLVPLIVTSLVIMLGVYTFFYPPTPRSMTSSMSVRTSGDVFGIV